MKLGKKVKDSFKKEFDSEPVYNKKYLKAKIKNPIWKNLHKFPQQLNAKRRFSIYLLISNFD